MLTIAFPSFKNLFQRIKRYLLLNDGYNYTNPMRLLSMYNTLEQMKEQDTHIAGARTNSIVVLETDNQERFSVVLKKPAEAKPENMEISVFSPLGAALMGAQEGSKRCVTIHGMEQQFKVIQIIH